MSKKCLGRFFIANRDMVASPERAQELRSGMDVIIEWVDAPDRNGSECVAESTRFFDPIEALDSIPEYRFIIDEKQALAAVRLEGQSTIPESPPPHHEKKVAAPKKKKAVDHDA